MINLLILKIVIYYMMNIFINLITLIKNIFLVDFGIAYIILIYMYIYIYIMKFIVYCAIKNVSVKFET